MLRTDEAIKTSSAMDSYSECCCSTARNRSAEIASYKMRLMVGSVILAFSPKFDNQTVNRLADYDSKISKI
jgi:hypothetical protein